LGFHRTDHQWGDGMVAHKQCANLYHLKHVKMLKDEMCLRPLSYHTAAVLHSLVLPKNVAMSVIGLEMSLLFSPK
jgi:hypothetical protein